MSSISRGVFAGNMRFSGAGSEKRKSTAVPSFDVDTVGFGQTPLTGDLTSCNCRQPFRSSDQARTAEDCFSAQMASNCPSAMPLRLDSASRPSQVRLGMYSWRSSVPMACAVNSPKVRYLSRTSGFAPSSEQQAAANTVYAVQCSSTSLTACRNDSRVCRMVANGSGDSRAHETISSIAAQIIRCIRRGVICNELDRIGAPAMSG